MKVLRHGMLLVATRVSGPSFNFLGLDFTEDVEPYERDLADESSPRLVGLEMVKQQVSMALGDHVGKHGTDPRIVGVLYLSTDTPSDSVYVMLATEIMEGLLRLDELDPFEPTWSRPQRGGSK